MTLSELENTVRKYLLLADGDIIKLLAAFIVAARLPINPPWLFIVGASSGGKSALLKSLQLCKGVFPLDDLTPTTFVSGMRGLEGKSNSLLDNLLPNSILLFKDFTTIIQKDKDSRGAVVSQLRKIYDGDLSKRFGNGVTMDWKGKLSVLAGVTSKIYTTMPMFAAMGERFLQFVLKQPDRMQMATMAADNLDDAHAEREIAMAFTAFIDNTVIPKELPVIDNTTKSQLAELAEFTTRCRTQVEREFYGPSKAIVQVHFLEMPARVVKELLGMALGFQVINGGVVTDADRRVLCTIALDSIPNIRRLCLQALTRYDEVETAGLAVHLRYPTDSVRLHLQDLAALDAIEFQKGPGNRDRWRIKNSYRKIMEFHEGITHLGEVLTEEMPPPEDDLRAAAEEVFGQESDGAPNS